MKFLHESVNQETSI